jgi:hypothetical protein
VKFGIASGHDEWAIIRRENSANHLMLSNAVAPFRFLTDGWFVVASHDNFTHIGYAYEADQIERSLRAVAFVFVRLPGAG